MATVEERVKAIATKKLGVDEIKLEDNFTGTVCGMYPGTFPE